MASYKDNGSIKTSDPRYKEGDKIVRPQKAKKMMQSRTSMGWFSFEEVNEACEIDSLQLIAERLVEELEDPKMVPSLLQNVVRVTEV